MLPKQAIEKAIEGGWALRDNYGEAVSIKWGQHGYATVSFKGGQSCHYQSFMQSYGGAETVVDKTFWQALGKALGWSTSCHHLGANGLYQVFRHEAICSSDDGRAFWEITAHEFYDLILTQATQEQIDAYWLELLK